MNDAAKDTDIDTGVCGSSYHLKLLQPDEESNDEGLATTRAAAAVTLPGGAINCSNNILLVYRLNEMRHMENLNFTLAIICLGYW
jgi:hypothetical protein